MQTSHHTIAAHRLVVLAEVNTVSQDWRDFLFKLSLAETLEEVATSISEEALLYNEHAINICFIMFILSVMIALLATTLVIDIPRLIRERYHRLFRLVV